ncbi:solute carrier family 2, facilitated glucose transporter member 1 [Patella vulgata]|uniref:solute carrier family 2, facilitated glucose transporter member 1 n=1 Tax=Patella vulgata TaxID=6465 RepID=UPI00217F9EF5|nr:solute carrier family 2, facilitated glucose transporter member 1 [Patella vulgata]
MAGALIAGPVSGRYGSKKALLANNIFALLASGFSGSSKFLGLVEMLIVGRLLVGINSGFNCVVMPMYVTEISPVAIRGILGTGHQIGIGISVIMANAFGFTKVLGTEEKWPFLFAALAVFQLITLPWCPESPRFLMITKNNEKDAESALKWLRRSSDVHDDINEMKIERRELQSMKKFTVLDLMRNSDLRGPMIICIMIHLSQQLCGVSAFASYSTSIFTQILNSVELSTYLVVGLSTHAFLVCDIFTVFVERSGRRALHMAGMAGMAVSLTLITFCFVYQEDVDWLKYGSLIGVFGFVFFFNIGPGSIPWFIVAEMFTQQSKSSAVTISVFFNFMSASIVSFVFPSIQEYIQNYSFVPFIGLIVMFWIYFYFKLPETKGRTIEEIADQFRSKKTKAMLKLMESDGVSNSLDYSTETVNTQL